MKNKNNRKSVKGLALLAAALIAVICAAYPAFADSLDELAKRLAEIRQEVEALSNDITAAREDAKAELRSLAAQKQELQMEREREEMRLKQLQAAKAKRVAEVVDDSNRDELLEPVVLRSADAVAAAISASLPFKKEERLLEIDKLKRKRTEGLIRSADAAARLWDRVEDELRLAGENGIYRQVVKVGSEEMLVDVARVGMVMLFYKTKDGDVGRAEKQGNAWRFVPLSDPEDKKRVLELFDSFKKQIRTGFFILPATLSEYGDKR